MKINPYYQRQKCSSGIVVSSKMRFVDIALEMGRQMRVGWSKIAIFLSFAQYIVQTFTPMATIIILCYVVP